MSERALEIFRRFASVLSFTYRRYLDLKEAEKRNSIIQADNERKTRELEEARQLLLSMLPKELPALPHLDMAACMKTSSEVDGDDIDSIVEAVLLLSDGLPELRNTNNEQYGCEIVKQEFMIPAEGNPSEIAEYLKHSA